MIENEQVAAAGCVTVNAMPAIVSVPFLATPLLEATLKLTLPDPVPEAPEVMEIHCALLDAVQPQADVVATPTWLPVLAAAATDRLVGLSANEQAAAAWLTVSVWLPTTSVPTRAAPVLGAAENAALPLPLPLVPDPTDSQGTVLLTVHAQPEGAAMAIGRFDAPPAATACDVGLIETLQLPA